MIKRILITIALFCLMVTSVQAAGLTVWGLTDGASQEYNGRVGYMLGSEARGGLEPFVGTSIFPNDPTPSTLKLGAVQHLPDILDPNSPIPFIPGAFKMLFSGKITARPYFGGEATITFIDEDAGSYAALLGAKVKFTDEDPSEWIFETGYGNTFSALNEVPDNELFLRMGVRIPF